MRTSASTAAAHARTVLFGTLALLAAGPAAAQLAEAPPVSSAVNDTGPARPRSPTPPPLETPFALAQLRYDRVAGARLESRFEIKRSFRERGIRYPAAEIFFRIFKRERALEVWVRPEDEDRFALLKSYDICALAGELGPKRRQGDLQVPEGFYYIDHFNPLSEYLLSLHVDYPNRSDAILGDTTRLGGDIFIHGGCNSEGCIAITDDGIQELYWLSVEARGAGQQRIPVHIFPARLSDVDLPLLTKAFTGRPALVKFWQGLKPGYDYFERERRVPRMDVSHDGGYRLAGEERAEPAPLGTPASSGPVPLGTPVPLGRPVEGEAPAPLGKPVEGGKAAPPAAADPKKPVPLGKPVEGGKAAPPAAADPKKPVPLGRPVGGGH